MYEILTLGILITGFLLMIGAMRLRVAFNLLGVIILSAIILPFLSSEIKGLDNWLLLILSVILTLLLFQWMARLIFGRSAADSVVASLISNILIAPFRLLISILRSIFFRRSI